MIPKTNQRKIEILLQPLLHDYFQGEDAQTLLGEKESGHVMGTIIEDRCGVFLSENDYTIVKEVNKLGEEKARAHSDFNIVLKSKDFLLSDNTNRVNVKFSGETNGQPNICSIRRVLDSLHKGEIDAYYLLKVKHNRSTNTTQVFFVDILDYLDCVTYNGGTGQLMLKEKSFYETYGNVPERTLVEKRRMLFDLYDTKMKEHIILKEKQIIKYQEQRNEFEDRYTN